eukprot:CAMPEP_0172636084 /NCGR_PEP_ID=MMETSP1068-20121228/202313_1 /TAXON_ID=35684 /ORGANISM="Pseudopedinella elastica, Strain CCMP716" /LENGTH=118 /DNA_ID=CAMNT_0013448447 /DNA_START=94 /DNA_END=450 /DNA_ORIENTATION=-
MAAPAGGSLYWRPGDPFSSTEMDTWLLVAGWVYTAVLSNLVVWPLATQLRKLPVLKEMLLKPPRLPDVALQTKEKKELPLSKVAVGDSPVPPPPGNSATGDCVDRPLHGHGGEENTQK